MDEKTEQEIIKLYFENLSIKQIVQITKQSSRQVEQALRCAGLNNHRKQHYVFNEMYFDDVNSDEKAYILGLLFTDGFIDVERNSIVYSSKDIELVYFFLDKLSVKNYTPKKVKSGFENGNVSYIVRLSSHHMADALQKFGYYGKKSDRVVNIPSINNLYLNAFLRGYIDGDGAIWEYDRTYHTTHHSYTYHRCAMSIIGTEETLNFFLQILGLSKRKFAKSHTPGMYYLNINSQTEIKNIWMTIYKGCLQPGLQRKQLILFRNFECH